MDSWEGAQLNTAKEILAFELTKLVHGEEEAQKAQESARALFSRGNAAEMPTTELTDADFTEGSIDILTMLVRSGLVPSKSEARRAVQQGGTAVDGEKVTDIKAVFAKDVFAGEGVILKKGKEKFPQTCGKIRVIREYGLWDHVSENHFARGQEESCPLPFICGGTDYLMEGWIMSMNQTPSSERVHIGFFGRRNAGKSSVMNAVTGQAIALVSDVRGTTTDPVYKSMELLPLGPVVMMDTPGIDDEGELGKLRVRKSYQVLNKTDAAVLVIDGTVGAAPEDMALLERIREKKIPYVIAVNKKEAAEEAALQKTVEQLSLEKADSGDGEKRGKRRKREKRETWEKRQWRPCGGYRAGDLRERGDRRGDP